jgi:hypothetical protein
MRQIIELGEFVGLVSAEVAGKLEAEESFTHWDITKAIREDNPDISIPHDAVRAVVTGMYVKGEMPGYEFYLDHSILGGPIRYAIKEEDDGDGTDGDDLPRPDNQMLP